MQRAETLAADDARTILDNDKVKIAESGINAFLDGKITVGVVHDDALQNPRISRATCLILKDSLKLDMRLPIQLALHDQISLRCARALKDARAKAAVAIRSGASFSHEAAFATICQSAIINALTRTGRQKFSDCVRRCHRLKSGSVARAAACILDA